MPTVTVRYYGAARAAARVAEERVTVPEQATVHDVLAAIGARHGRPLTSVLARCSYLVDELAVRPRTSPVRLPSGAVLDVLPPFAGGSGPAESGQS